MTPEELDKARAEEAVKNWPQGAIALGVGGVQSLLADAARLAREGWVPPEPVDPDLIEARKIWLECAPDLPEEVKDRILMGSGDGGTGVQGCLAAIKRGRELERKNPSWPRPLPSTTVDIRAVKDGERVRVTMEAEVSAQLHNEVYLTVSHGPGKMNYSTCVSPGFLDRCIIEKIP